MSGGIILYAYDGKQDWYLNGVHCKTGYIIIQKTDGLEERVKKKYNLNYLSGQVHGAVYASVFGRNIDVKVLGSGFSYNGKEGKKKTWKWRSMSLNKQDGFHVGNGKVTPIENKWVRKALENWIKKGTQNTKINEPFGIARLKQNDYDSDDEKKRRNV